MNSGMSSHTDSGRRSPHQFPSRSHSSQTAGIEPEQGRRRQPACDLHGGRHICNRSVRRRSGETSFFNIKMSLFVPFWFAMHGGCTRQHDHFVFACSIRQPCAGYKSASYRLCSLWCGCCGLCRPTPETPPRQVSRWRLSSKHLGLHQTTSALRHPSESVR